MSRLLLAGLCLPLSAGVLGAQASHGEVTVRGIKVLGSKDTVEIEVESGDRLVPQARVLSGPDRLVVDFPNAVPGATLRSQSINRGEVKDVRIGLFQSKPPITRVVLDLKTAQSYQIFPYGRTTIIKITGSTTEASAGVDKFPPGPSVATQPRAGLVSANYSPGAEAVKVEPVAAGQPLTVTFHDGLLAIKADKSTLSEVLLAIQQRTGAQVGIAAGAEQEKVVVDLGPAPAPEVLAQLLHGSKFNFLILSSASDPRQLERVILSARTDGGAMPLAQVQNNSISSNDDEDVPPAQPQGQPGNGAPPPVQATRPQPPDVNNPPDDNSPDQ